MLNSLIGRNVSQGAACDPTAASYAISGSGQALICAAGGTWQPVPAQAAFVVWH